MIVAGHQPNYLPYAGFFHKIGLADLFVIVDHVQFNKKSWQNRNRVRTREGWTWLTVPVLTKGKFDQPIDEVELNNLVPWRAKHWKTIRACYEKAPHFARHAGFLEELYSREWTRLAALAEAIVLWLLRELAIEVPVRRSREMGITEPATGLLIELCRKVGADTYLSGPGGRKYVDEERVRAAGLGHVFQEFTHPVYPQRFEPFVPGLSMIDMLFNCGAEECRLLLAAAGGRR